MIGFIENLAKRAGNVLLSHFGEEQQLLKLRSSVGVPGSHGSPQTWLSRFGNGLDGSRERGGLLYN